MKKALHISFHDGCLADVDFLFENYNISIDKIKIPRKLNSDFNISSDKSIIIAPYLRAIIGDYKNIIFSDTAPLARSVAKCPSLFQGIKIFHYICNRYNYGLNDLNEYKKDFNKLIQRNDSIIAVYTDYENYYLSNSGINKNFPVIKPTGLGVDKIINSEHKRTGIIDNNKGLLFPYLNEGIFYNNLIKEKLYFDKYNGPAELKNFKYFVHFPYAFSNYFLFEILRLNKNIYVPDLGFIVNLLKSYRINYHFQDLPRRRRYLMSNNELAKIISYSEWYSDDVKNRITYFESVAQLNKLIDKENNINNINNNSLHDSIDNKNIEKIYNFFN